ncbi:hypothetical protein B0H03_12117 [Rathayibacter iranicus NCPPB 2253 = VKM Ac-1602]|nr:hypothetical protein B0H03_12117 [Rathayibacter iranicus NCPPB 2253 = VKM Ac-1602]
MTSQRPMTTRPRGPVTHPAAGANLKRAAAASIIGAVILGAGAAALTIPAQAAAIEGAGGRWTPGGGYLGNYIATDGSGKRVYCVDVQMDSTASGGPGTVQSEISPVDGTRAVTGDELRKLNYAITVWGQTADANQAAAVSAYVYNFTSANWSGQGSHYIDGGDVAAITALYNQIFADTEANYTAAVGGGSGTGTGDLTFAVDSTNNYAGTLTVSNLSPADANGTITLTNGVFTDTGLSTRDGVGNNSTLNITGVAPEDGSDYKISAKAAFTSANGGGSSYDANATLYYDEIQRSAGPGTMTSGPGSFTISAEDPTTRSPNFNPVVGTTVAAKYVQAGQKFQDTLTFSSVAGADGVNNAWPQRGDDSYVEVKANGTLYYTGSKAPVESDTVPGDAVVAGSATVTTGAQGPAVTYTAASDTVAEKSGYYTWVWSINEADQSDVAKRRITDGYSFTDRFGQVPETHVSPSNIIATSQVTADTIPLSGKISDTLKADLGEGGAWLQDGTNRVPVTFRGTAYYVEGATAPSTSDTVPANAAAVGSTTITTDQPGTFTSTELTAPDAAKAGYISWVWEITEEDQPEQYRGYITEWADRFGLVNETQQLTTPTVATQAQPEAAPKSKIHDTATITGTMPATGSGLYFTAYQGVEGQPAVCDATTQIFTNKDTPQTVTETGDYDSLEFTATRTGPVYWVESLVSDKGNLIHQGECGIPNETTLVKNPTVTTKADANVVIEDEAHDTAIVDGPVAPGTTAIFNAYRQPQVGDIKTNEDGTPVLNPDGTNVLLTDADLVGATCMPTNLVGSTKDRPVAVKAGDNDRAEYLSPGLVFHDDGKVFWIETLRDADGEVIHAGECGAPGETTVVERPKVSTTAVADVTLGKAAHDTGQVTGLTPEGAYLTFNAYKKDEDVATPTCTPETAVYDGSKEHLPVAGPGSYDSKDTTFTEVGTYFWVERLWVDRDGTPVLLHEGECGAPNETTIVKAAGAGLASTGFDLAGFGVLAGLLMLTGAGVATGVAVKRRKARATA